MFNFVFSGDNCATFHFHSVISFYYGATIFESVGIQDSFVTQIILGAVNFGCTFGGLYIMEKVSVYS